MLFPVIVLAHTLLARCEETKMMQQFGQRYEAYRQRVPMFFPTLRRWRRLLTPAECPCPRCERMTGSRSHKGLG
jgi:hypothetical protein